MTRMPIALQITTRVAAIFTLIVMIGVPMAKASGAKVSFGATVVKRDSTALEPLTASTTSFTDRAALRFKSVNRKSRAVSVSYTAFGSDNTPLKLTALKVPSRLQPRSAALSTIIVPVTEIGISKIKVCSIHKDRKGTVMDRTCEDFIVKRVILSE